jgi:hypothetical protein
MFSGLFVGEDVFPANGVVRSGNGLSVRVVSPN